MQNELDCFDEPPCATEKNFLFHVVPEGGGEYSEGLLSWFIGVAHAHSLSPRVLMKHLMQQSDAHRDVWNGTTFFEKDAVTVNGFGKYARMAVELLQPNTDVAVEAMTMLHLKDLLPHNGEGALARNPKWCPFCMCEQVRSGQRPHYRLVWSFEHYRVCPQHKVRLSDRCPACGSLQSFVPIFPSLVHCGHCGHPLLASVPEGEANADSKPECTEFELWCSQSLDDVLARRSLVEERGSLITFRTNIVEVVQKLSPGNKKLLCESVGLHAYALNGWLNKNERPSLSVLLKFCSGISVSVTDMFLAGAATFAAEPSCRSTALRTRNARPQLGFQRRGEMEELLNVIIEDSTDCRPLSEIAGQLGLSRSALKYWFRQQCQEIVLKNRNFESRRQEVRYLKDHEILRSIIQELRAKNLQPSRRRVDAKLRLCGLALARPDIFQAYEKSRTTVISATFPGIEA